jgi:regulator of protease activity HflC (stomatin/prohibitin superfamily)
MLGIRFVRTPPTTYVLHYKNGAIRREGAGLAFFYYAPTSTLVTVPLQSADLPFVFREQTVDFQDVTIQGQLSYRVSDPRRLAGLLDFSLGKDGRHASDALEILRQRLVNATQALTRAVIQTRRLKDALVGLDSLEQDVRDHIAGHTQVAMLGVEVLGVSILSIKPTPEMGKALEAEAREELQREADRAVYDRRNAAVEQERRIKENELSTEIAVEEKRRTIREKKIAADIAIEEQRAALVDLELENDKKTADGRGYALAASLEPLKSLDWKTLMTISPGGGAELVIASAFRELAENAAKIGELNISPDLLRALVENKRGS